MQEDFLLPILRWNFWMVWARLSAFARKRRKATAYETFSFLFRSEKNENSKNMLTS